MSPSHDLITHLDLDRYPPGTIQRLRLYVADYPDGTPISVPFTLIVGRTPGPKVVAVGGVHGDEFEGPRALIELARTLDPAHLVGSVVLVPLANPLAYAAGTRNIPEDGLNLNRIFPGDPHGSVGQRLAQALVHRLIAPADLAIDLHSAGVTGRMLPMSGFREAQDETARRSAEAAAGFGLAMYWMMAWAPGTLSTALNQLGIPAVGCEAGGLGSADQPHVELYRDGVVRCLRLLGLVQPSLSIEVPRAVRTMEAVTAPASGLLDLRVSLGEEVRIGELLARILDPWGETVGEVVAPFDGRVVHQRVFRRVQPGDTVVSLGRELPNPVVAG